MTSNLRADLEQLIDKYCLGQNSSTSTDVLADYLLHCLLRWNELIEESTLANIELQADGVKDIRH